jgi:hypothetical protein
MPSICRRCRAFPTRTLLAALPTGNSRWVVRDNQTGYYDGLSGAVLHWHDGAFTPTTTPATPAAAFTTTGPAASGSQLTLSLRTQHPADDSLLLGGALQTAWQTLTDTPPAGWSTAEPANQPWSRPEITDLSRRRAPDGTWLVTIGTPDRPAIATTRITRTTTGVEEDITLAIGYTPDEQPPLDALPGLADALVTEHHAQTILIQRRAARRDLTIPPRLEAPPIPDAVHDIGPDHAYRSPVPAQTLGAATRPGLFYALGNGTSPDAWKALEQLMRHLRQPMNG